MEKNKDELHEDLKKVMLKSGNDLVKTLFESHTAKLDKFGRAKKVKTIGKKFSSSLNKLSEMLESTKSHFIRCIKSNSQKKAGIFDTRMILDQLQYSGVFDVARFGRPVSPSVRSTKTFVECISALYQNNTRKCRFEYKHD